MKSLLNPVGYMNYFAEGSVETPTDVAGKVEAECRVEAYPNTINYWTKQGLHEPEMLLNK